MKRTQGIFIALAAALLLTVTGQSAAAQATRDPRVGLRAGTMVKWPADTTRKVVKDKAAEAAWNIKLTSSTPASDNFKGVTNSDLAFTGKYAIQGNYNGYQVWDISNPVTPTLATAYLCPASQSDVSVSGKLLFVSSEAPSGRTDCGRGPMDSVSNLRMRGIRVFDGTDIAKPKYLTNVQSCRGSHTHTVLNDPKDKENVYIYISGTSNVRPASELPGCLAGPAEDKTSACFRIEVIQVPVAHPEQAKMVSSARIFDNLPGNLPNAARTKQDSIERAQSAAAAAAARGAAGAGRGGRGGGRGGDSAGRGGAARGAAPAGGGGRCGAPAAAPGGAAPAAAAPRGPNQCHDITVYPAIGLAGGACAGLGLLLDIRNPANPVRVDFVADSNFSFWHSATFNNDGTQILFSDEWGGGSAPRCRSTDKMTWGADALFSLANNKMSFKGYYKMPAPQTKYENCVAHNGSLIPIPGRDVMVQAWYQGGISVFDWTDAAHPKEIAYFDRGPLEIPTDSLARAVTGGSWSAYWYNGMIVSSEIQRGLDIFELTPSPFISQNEIDAAKTVRYAELNVQDQPKMVWPASFSRAKAFVDQLERSKGLTAARITAVRADLAAAEKATGAAKKDGLTKLAASLNTDAAASSDAAKVRMLSAAVTELGR